MRFLFNLIHRAGDPGGASSAESYVQFSFRSYVFCRSLNQNSKISFERGVTDVPLCFQRYRSSRCIVVAGREKGSSIVLPKPFACRGLPVSETVVGGSLLVPRSALMATCVFSSVFTGQRS